MILNRDPKGLENITYDYTLLTSLFRRAPQNTRLYSDLNRIMYYAEQRKNINLELELRKAVMAHYFN